MTKLIFLACECCHALNEESAVVTREEIAVMPNGEWLCDDCYRDCDKTQYGFVPEDRDDFEYPDFDDMPRPPLITAIYEQTTRHAGVAAVEGDAVVIRFPLSKMQVMIDGSWGCNAFETRQKVTDEALFAKEFCRALNTENEVGTTLVHRMADKAFVKMMEHAALGMADHEIASPTAALTGKDGGAAS